MKSPTASRYDPFPGFLRGARDNVIPGHRPKVHEIGPVRAEGRAEGRAAGRAEGRAEQRALLRRLAARRFDAGTAERLAELIADVDDPVDLADVGDWIIDCATRDELLERCSGLRDRPPPAAG